MSTRKDERLEVRRGHYKAAIDGDEARRRREDSMVKIRKGKKEEGLLKKRKQKMTETTTSESSTRNVMLENMIKSLAETMMAIYSDDVRLQFQATKSFSKVLEIEEKPTAEGVIKLGLVPRFVEFLTREDFPELQFEAASALANIVSGTSEHTKAVVDCGAIPILVHLLCSPKDDVREQAIWALGNVAGDSPSFRDLVLSYGTLGHLLRILSDNGNPSLKKTATWALSVICKAQLPPEMKMVILSALERLIHSDDEEVLTDVCHALSFLSAGNHDEIQAVVDAGVCPRLVELLLIASDSLMIPAIRTVSNIVSGSDSQMQQMIDCHVVPSLLKVLTNTQKKRIKKEACWIIAHITSGSKEQIQAVINADVIPLLVHLMQTAGFVIQREAAWAIGGIASGGTPEHIRFLVHHGCIRPICNLLECSDRCTVMMCLDCLDNILRVAGKEGARMVKDCEGLDKIESLLGHDKAEIYEKALEILEKYWSDDSQGMPSSVLHK